MIPRNPSIRRNPRFRIDMKIAYFDCFSGISGDMTLGALIDAGADSDSLKAELGKLQVDGYAIRAAKVTKSGISATDVTVSVEHHGAGHGRSFSRIARIIEDSGLSEGVASMAVAIFRRLGEAEAQVHGKSIEEIHFHEVGAVDAIVDIVGASICLDMLGIERVHTSPMPTFTGTVKMAHGAFPLPAPATIEILKGAPWRELGIEGELVTPTGAAIAAEISSGFGPMPPMTVQSVGYGAGKSDFEIPNVLRVVVGESGEPGEIEPSRADEDEVSVIETNIDDLSPQFFEVVMDSLFAHGALDVYMTPIQMKKNRPAVLLSVICRREDIQRLTDILFEETSTIGIRIDTRKRICLPREVESVQTAYGRIAVKVARRCGRVLNVQPEYEDCKNAAAQHSTPIKRVRDAAVVAFYEGKS